MAYDKEVDLSDPFLNHEVLHGTSMVSSLFDKEILEHPYVQGTPAALEEATKVSDALAEFYQELGGITLPHRTK